MAGEHDSWLKSAFELDVSKILTSTPGDGAAAPEFSSGATANSMASGFQKQAEGALEVLGSARRALGDLEQAKLDVAKGVVIKGISGVAGATAGLASAAGDEDFADELRAAQANADADANMHFERAGQKLDEARQGVPAMTRRPPNDPTAPTVAARRPSDSRLDASKLMTPQLSKRQASTPNMGSAAGVDGSGSHRSGGAAGRHQACHIERSAA